MAPIDDLLARMGGLLRPKKGSGVLLEGA